MQVQTTLWHLGFKDMRRSSASGGASIYCEREYNNCEFEQENCDSISMACSSEMQTVRAAGKYSAMGSGRLSAACAILIRVSSEGLPRLGCSDFRRRDATTHQDARPEGQQTS